MCSIWSSGLLVTHTSDWLIKSRDNLSSVYGRIDDIELTNMVCLCPLEPVAVAMIGREGYFFEEKLPYDCLIVMSSTMV